MTTKFIFIPDQRRLMHIDDLFTYMANWLWARNCSSELLVVPDHKTGVLDADDTWFTETKSMLDALNMPADHYSKWDSAVSGDPFPVEYLPASYVCICQWPMHLAHDPCRNAHYPQKPGCLLRSHSGRLIGGCRADGPFLAPYFAKVLLLNSLGVTHMVCKKDDIDYTHDCQAIANDLHLKHPITLHIGPGLVVNNSNVETVMEATKLLGPKRLVSLLWRNLQPHQPRVLQEDMPTAFQPAYLPIEDF